MILYNSVLNWRVLRFCQLYWWLMHKFMFYDSQQIAAASSQRNISVFCVVSYVHPWRGEWKRSFSPDITIQTSLRSNYKITGKQGVRPIPLTSSAVEQMTGMKYNRIFDLQRRELDWLVRSFCMIHDDRVEFVLISEFSFWVAANMPLDDNLRLQILCINCPTQRLRRELDIVRKVIRK